MPRCTAHGRRERLNPSSGRVRGRAKSCPRSASEPGRCSTCPPEAQTSTRRSPRSAASSRTEGESSIASPMYGRSEERVGDILEGNQTGHAPLPCDQDLDHRPHRWRIAARGTRTGCCARRRSIWCRSTTSRISTRTCPRCEAAREAGTIRYIGVTHYLRKRTRRTRARDPMREPDSCRSTIRWQNRRRGRGLLPLAQELGVAVLVNRPFTKGAMIDRAAGARTAARCRRAHLRERSTALREMGARRSSGHGRPRGNAQSKACGRKSRGGLRARPDSSQRKAIATWFSSL